MNVELAKWIVENLDFDQLILEYHNAEGFNSGWIHCSYKSPTDNRKQTLRAFRNDQGKTQYVEYKISCMSVSEFTKDEVTDMYMQNMAHKLDV